MTLSPTIDSLALLDSDYDPRLVELLDEMPLGPVLWWEADHTVARQAAWSVGFLHDLIAVVDAATGFPYAVIGDARSGRWMQVFGTTESGFVVEIAMSGVEKMGVMGRVGGRATPTKVHGCDTHVECKLHQVLQRDAAHAALES
ncbi:hypothetical protein [Cryobacterium sp. CG_9.6]|uniref:hypothetical protein n=1 Tax=Cryobacterium sp. CG_9.6 TaxID=2760710 RepID=UPI0024730C4B|nr:hypothetical protein [Cryobacterium sp. CG_9.6]MDH6236272.1 hypothetical protein [Cryobacterium sp. CG_9.6]